MGEGIFSSNSKIRLITFHTFSDIMDVICGCDLYKKFRRKNYAYVRMFRWNSKIVGEIFPTTNQNKGRTLWRGVNSCRKPIMWTQFKVAGSRSRKRREYENIVVLHCHPIIWCLCHSRGLPSSFNVKHSEESHHKFKF